MQPFSWLQSSPLGRAAQNQHLAMFRAALWDLFWGECQPFALPAAVVLIFTSGVFFCIQYLKYLNEWVSWDPGRPFWQNLLAGSSLPLGVALHVALLVHVAYWRCYAHGPAREGDALAALGPLLVKRITGPPPAQPGQSGKGAGAAGQPGAADPGGGAEAAAPGKAAEAAAAVAAAAVAAAMEEAEPPSEQRACPICCSPMTHKEALLRTICGHIFHEGCLGKWLPRSPTCPVCRCDLRSGPFAV